MLKFLQALIRIEKPATDLRQGIFNSIKNIAQGANLKISEEPNKLKIMNSENAVVVIQFGGRRDFYEMMEALNRELADYKIIITSSNVKSIKIGEIKWILNTRYQTKDKWLIIDIEHKENPKTINFMLYEMKNTGPNQNASRRKKIYGTRGEYKKQD
ncbi:MAG: hypothetical protein AB1391_00970 [Candidatus Micrarchaeota archaeon]